MQELVHCLSLFFGLLSGLLEVCRDADAVAEWVGTAMVDKGGTSWILRQVVLPVCIVSTDTAWPTARISLEDMVVSLPDTKEAFLVTYKEAAVIVIYLLLGPDRQLTSI